MTRASRQPVKWVTARALFWSHCGDASPASILAEGRTVVSFGISRNVFIQANTDLMSRKFAQCVAAALCCLTGTAIAASDNPKELERVLAKVRSEPMIFVAATGEPNACGQGCSEWIAGEGEFDEGAAH